MLNTIAENVLIQRLAAGLPRSPFQLNHLQESDAELLGVPWGEISRLACTTDTIAEEISNGLYTDPWLIGWMTVIANMSDLAAVGATPLGILIAETLPEQCNEEFLQRLQDGIADACNACDTYVLGGDTNAGEVMSMTGCAIGILGPGKLLTRVGCQPGDILFSSGPLGCGSAYAFGRLSHVAAFQVPYRPLARLREGRLLRPFASACMDTSDGALATLDQLMRLNHAGFVLGDGWENALHQTAATLIGQFGMPAWFPLAGEHGEFELLFTIPAGSIDPFLTHAATIGWQPIRMGSVIASPEIQLTMEGINRSLDTGQIRNLAALARTDLQAYLVALWDIHAQAREISRQQYDNSLTSQGRPAAIL